MRYMLEHPDLATTRLDLCRCGARVHDRPVLKSFLISSSDTAIIDKCSLLCEGSHQHSIPDYEAGEAELVTTSLASHIANVVLRPVRPAVELLEESALL